MGKQAKQIKFQCIDNGKVIKTYNSIREAVIDTQVNVSSLYKVLFNQGHTRHTAGGYYWKLLDNAETDCYNQSEQ